MGIGGDRPWQHLARQRRLRGRQVFVRGIDETRRTLACLEQRRHARDDASKLRVPADAVKTAVINKRGGGMGLILGRKAFQKPFAEGVALIQAVQDVYRNPEITVA